MFRTILMNFFYLAFFLAFTVPAVAQTATQATDETPSAGAPLNPEEPHYEGANEALEPDNREPVEAGEPEAVGRYAGQGALSEPDVKKYIQVMTNMIKVSDDMVKMQEVVRDSGWDQLRFAYVNTRISMVMEVIKGGDAVKSSLPKALVPTDEEINLVKPHQAALDALNEEALKAITAHTKPAETNKTPAAQ